MQRCPTRFLGSLSPGGSFPRRIELPADRIGNSIGFDSDHSDERRQSPARMENEKYSSDDRKLMTYVAYSVILVAVFASAVYRATKDRAVVSVVATSFVASVFLVILLLCDMTLRLCQTLVTFTTDVGQESEESFWSVVKYHFTLNTPSAMVVVVSVLLVFGLIGGIGTCPFNYAWDFGPCVCVPLIMFSFWLLRMCNLAEWETGSLADLSAMKGLDYGTGMAYSFYYGYLRLILPSTGTSTKGIVEKIENFEDNHNVTFPVHKLFILIPSSGYIPSDLKEASQWMESASELEEEVRNRAGNIRRTYRNNAYKIYPGGRSSRNEPVYVVAEGATPLLTYYEVQKHNHPESIVYKRYKRKIIEMFYRKLRDTLQSEPDTRDLCELIYYNDYDAKGDKVNVATIILERISEIRDSA
ncbi:stimulator of interferon genes protein homolog [Temnothorax longispinosus]